MRQPLPFLSLLLPVLAATVACEPPRTEVRTTAILPRIRIVDAPPGAEVFVDGKAVGLASAFNGDSGVLQLPSGTRHIEVRLNGRTLLSTQIFLEGEALRDILVPQVP